MERTAGNHGLAAVSNVNVSGFKRPACNRQRFAGIIITKSQCLRLLTLCGKGAALDADFIKSMLLEVAKNWNGAGSKTELKALLPEAAEKEFAARFGASAGELLAAGIEVGYSKDVRTGFKIGEKNGGDYISFTDESFAALMHEYLREKVSRMLFE